MLFWGYNWNSFSEPCLNFFWTFLENFGGGGGLSQNLLFFALPFWGIVVKKFFFLKKGNIFAIFFFFSGVLKLSLFGDGTPKK